MLFYYYHVNDNGNDNSPFMMMNKRRATIKEVAQAAGVSTQTVSRVLNDRPDVSPETRERVRSVITTLGYSPNALARSLIQGRSNTIGVVSYGLSYYGPARILTGVERRANEIGYSMQLSLLRRPETNRGEEIFQNLLDRQVDGIIWAVPEIGTNREWLAEQIRTLSVPVVAIHMQPIPGVPMVAIDNREGGRLATKHLMAQGYQRIGIITGPESWWESQQRELGWRDAMQAAGFTDLDMLKAVGDWYPSSGSYGLEQLLARVPDLEAVFACNDPMAVGALQAARRLGRQVPENLAVVGFDDVPEAAYYFPSLTTIRQPLLELGAHAVEMLSRIFSESREIAAGNEPAALFGTPERDRSQLHQVWLPPQLIIRDSSRTRQPVPKAAQDE
jgi:LacI family transcriptional regulator